ncbi:MAG: hypothetical protein JSV80_08455, partial [Acidobacteriota bacterium]
MAPSSAAEPTPAELLAQIDANTLDVSRSVLAEGKTFNVGLARLRLLSGVLVPAGAPAGAAGRPANGVVSEFVFLGRAELGIEPPDAIEADQLELFTGRRKLEIAIEQAVLAIASPALAQQLMSASASHELDQELRARAQQLFASWKSSVAPRVPGVRTGQLLARLGEPGYESFFAAWCHSSELGDFIYRSDPSAVERYELGKLELVPAGERPNGDQRWTTWISSSEHGTLQPSRTSGPFEPEHYELDVDVAWNGRSLEGRATLRLDVREAGHRVVLLDLDPSIDLERVVDGSSSVLSHVRAGSDLLVFLPEAPAVGQKLTLGLSYSGPLIDRLGIGEFELVDTQRWYPHAGLVDRATYTLTIRWPRRLDLLASGRVVASGSTEDYRRWQRRELDVPSFGVTFELGFYEIFERHVGDVKLSVALVRRSLEWMDLDEQRRFIDNVERVVAFMQKRFGPPALDYLTVAVSLRDFSQSHLGLITIGHQQIRPVFGFGQAPQRTLVGMDYRQLLAHEVAHQWWGGSVGWLSYRDEWLSEGLAEYAALQYARHADIRGAGSSWINWHFRRTRLHDLLPSGHRIEWVGPISLGRRLNSSFCPVCYAPIVRGKAAFVLDSLSRILGEERFLLMLRYLHHAASGRALTTAQFFAALERMASVELDWFASRYVLGSGVPRLFYSYDSDVGSEGERVLIIDV